MFSRVCKNEAVIDGVRACIVDETTQTPLVSVTMITYNHEAFIEQAVRGVIMQETDFAYELVIGEDCSSDSTRDIVRSLQKEFPDKIVLKLPECNLGVMRNSVSNKLLCRGQYIAECEGDDYWTDPLKLQKQVDFLEKHPDFSLVAHQCSVLRDGKLEHSEDINAPIFFDTNSLLDKNPFYTLSLVFRNLIDFQNSIFGRIDCIDWFNSLILSKSGKACLLPDVMGVYRMHPGGTWLQTSGVKVAAGKFHMYEYMKSIFPEHHKLIIRCQAEIVNAYCRDKNFCDMIETDSFKFAFKNLIHEPILSMKIFLKRLLVLFSNH